MPTLPMLFQVAVHSMGAASRRRFFSSSSQNVLFRCWLWKDSMTRLPLPFGAQNDSATILDMAEPGSFPEISRRNKTTLSLSESMQLWTDLVKQINLGKQITWGTVKTPSWVDNVFFLNHFFVSSKMYCGTCTVQLTGLCHWWMGNRSIWMRQGLKKREKSLILFFKRTKNSITSFCSNGLLPRLLARTCCIGKAIYDDI